MLESRLGFNFLKTDLKNSNENYKSFIILTIIIFFFSIIFIFFFKSIETIILGIILNIFSSGAAIGALAGFLFGIPRSVEIKDNAQTKQGSLSETAKIDAKRYFSSNTNLEKLSDWLTTMLVGIGLSQMSSILESLSRFGNFILFSIPKHNQEEFSFLSSISPLVLIFGLLTGFIVFFLYTRIHLAVSLNQTEKSLDSSNLYNKIAPEKALNAIRESAAYVSENSEAPKSTKFDLKDKHKITLSDGISVMFASLYKPGGYQKTIDIGKMLEDTEIVNDGQYWFLLSAAFGQKYKILKQELNDKTQQESARNARRDALLCAEKAVKIDPIFKKRLWNISNPDSLDDDLSELRYDEDFLKLVGRA